MSMQSHLAELEKKHQALEDEINECLTHPATDDLHGPGTQTKKIAGEGRNPAATALRERQRPLIRSDR